jgi:hypothetical protein
MEQLSFGEDAQFLAQAAAKVRLQGITQRFVNGQLTERQWVRLMQAEIQESAITSFLIGYENKSGITIKALADLPGPALRSATNYVNQQMRYFTNWRNDLLQKAGFDSSKVSAVLTQRDVIRGGMYGSATDGAFNKGKVSASLESEEKELIYWRLRPVENCISCVALQASSPYSASGLPTEPGAGDTECRSNCQCYLEFEKKAA